MTAQVHSPPPLPAMEQPPFVARKELHEKSSPNGTVAAATLAIWLVCLVVGVLGLRLGYPGPHVPAADVPVIAKIIHVDLTHDESHTGTDAAPGGASPAPPDNPASPPAIPALADLPAATPLMAVAEPSPAIAFAVPAQGPSQLVDPRQAAPASHQGAAPAPNAAVSGVRHLTFGQGEGAQPSPEYPPEAARAGEQGVVTVRFTVAESGKVASADIVSPCRWPMLNQAALRAVRDHWNFGPGEQRLYEISIRFQLNEK